MSALLRAFQRAAATGAAARTTYDTADVAGLLGALYARGRDAHPKLRVSEDAFGQALGRCAGDRPLRSLDGFAIEDLYLACACIDRVRGAAAAFEAAHGRTIRRAVSRVVTTADDRADAEQRVRQHLLVGVHGGGPALAKYPAQMPLAKWLPVVAIRVAISLNRSETAERKLRDKAAAEAMAASPEDMLIRAELRRAVEPAVAEALRSLPDRDRLILRLFLVSGMSTPAIGRTLGVSQQAISKRIARARDALLEDIRAMVAARLNIGENEFSSLMRVVASQLDVNISRLLRKE